MTSGKVATTAGPIAAMALDMENSPSTGRTYLPHRRQPATSNRCMRPCRPSRRHSLRKSGGFTRWEGDLLMGSLKAQSLFRMRLDGDRVVYAEPIQLDRRIRDVRQMGDMLVLLTDQGSLLTLRCNAKPLDKP